MSVITLYKGDSIEQLNNIKDNTVNCVITSPPYNVDLGNNKYNKNKYNSYDDNKPYDEYIRWLESIFFIVKSKLVDGGRVCINIGDGKNGAIPTHSDIIQFMTKRLGYGYISTILWNKSQIGNRTAWGSWLSPSSPSYPCPFEYILMFYKGDRSLQHTGEANMTKAEFIDYATALWSFPPETRLNDIGHPAAFPVELPRRCILMNTYVNDVVLDPFMGSGSTGVACINTNRNFIGIELDDEYFRISEERIKLAQVEPCATYKHKTAGIKHKKLF